jgi:rare lipoprotein A
MKIMPCLITLLLVANLLLGQREEYGLASYYSDQFHGKPTASGELYDKDAMTAAHKTLPFGTIIKVTRLDNKKSVQVKVNDRGPHISGRIVEVSRAAAQMLDLIRDGSAKVVVELVGSGTGSENTATNKPTSEPVNTSEPTKTSEPAKTSTAATSPATASAASTGVTKSQRPTEVAKDSKEIKEKNSKEAKTATQAEKSKAKTQAETSHKGAATNLSQDLYQVQLVKPEKKGFGVQVAALSSQDALFRKVADLQDQWFSNILVSVEQVKKETIYKIILGPFPDNSSAATYKENLKKNKKMDGFVVDLSILQSSN